MSALLSVENLSKSFVTRRNLLGKATSRFQAVESVSFTLDRGETLALVGESGAGKSTIGRLILRLLEADGGRVTFDGLDVFSLSRTALRQLRRRMQIVFQDPFSSLDPRVPVGESVAEPLQVHSGLSPKDRYRRASVALERVGIGASAFDRYPRELSGGQLQRVCIARALTMSPDLIVCDEPVAALDVSVQAQVLNLMLDLQDELGISYLFITHDLGLVESLADRVAVLKDGRLVEVAGASEIYSTPSHEYTRELLAAVPVPIPRSLRAAHAVGTRGADVERSAERTNDIGRSIQHVPKTRGTFTGASS